MLCNTRGRPARLHDRAPTAPAPLTSLGIEPVPAMARRLSLALGLSAPLAATLALLIRGREDD